MAQTISVLYALILVLFDMIGSSHGKNANWGTYRPHALISVRARVPHSPYFGVVWHRPNDADIRHLADHPDLSYFGWSRHNGDNFGDHEVIDPKANAVIKSSFVKTDDGDAWALKISGKPLRKRSSEDNRISVVFYAAAGPEENVGLDGEDSDQPWGTIKLQNDIDREGLTGEVKITGKSKAVGGRWTASVKEPTRGSIDNAQIVQSGRPWRIGRRKRREAQKDDVSKNLRRWHVAGPKGSADKAWDIEGKLKSLFESPNSEDIENNDDDVNLEDEDSIQGNDAEALHKDKVLTLPNSVDTEAPTLLIQRVLELPFEFDVLFSQNSTHPNDNEKSRHNVAELRGNALNTLLDIRRKEFDRRFASVFNLEGSTGLSQGYAEIGRRALANVLGGIGYFYGSILAQKQKSSAGDPGVGVLPPVALLSATPSRAVFPRGFLWDEGFHQLVVQRWDPSLSRECIKSWYETMQENGWIPREQVLGIEARERFPPHIRHLILQSPDVANPPTLLMPLRVLAGMKRTPAGDEGDNSCDAVDKGAKCESSSLQSSGFWSDITAAVARNYDWLRETQSGQLPGTFRWRGRSLTQVGPEGHPHTLASGLDDYPRATVPNENETHVDLYSWVTWGSSALVDISKASTSKSQSSDLYQSLRGELIHRVIASRGADAEMFCDSDGHSKICHKGYVTLFPLMLGLLEEDDPRVGEMLTWLEDEEILRSIAGIRSLSKSDPWYGKGDNYWTGPTWMPFNYLILGSLKTKYAQRGRFKKRAQKLYDSLRKDILSNVQRVFEKTGFLWEQYGELGEGRKGKQFTGWTATILLIAGEMYDGIL